MNKDFIELLARENALLFGDFTTKSGRKTPYFVNTGKICSGESLDKLASFFAQKIKDIGEPSIIYGPAYKGIPLAVATSISLYREHGVKTGWLFNRKEAKTHGDAGSFVGKLPEKGESVILVDDVFTAGGTKYESVELLKSMGAKVTSLVIGVDRQERGEIEKSKNAIEEFTSKTGIPVHPIAKTSEIFSHLRGKEIGGKIHITEELYSLYEKYRDEYGS
jgi:orotate phosphoribosyltransferase